MQRFYYEAVDPHGRKVVASAEAWDRASLLINLQSKGLVLVKWLDEERQDKPFLRFFKPSALTLDSGELLQVTKDLAHLLKSGVPIDRALTIIQESAKQQSVKKAANYLKESIQGGKTLSEAMAARKEFNDLYVNMVRVGEMGGILPQVMEKLYQFMERTQEIKRFILSSSIYPSILLIVGILSVLVIMGFVVPRFAGIFKDLGQEIPFSTNALIYISNYLRAWGWLFLIFILLFSIVIWRYAHTPSGKDRIDNLLIKTPFFGALIKDIQVSRFARTLGTLLLSGVPLLKALSIVQEVVENNVVKTAATHIYHQVKAGKRISTLMSESDPFPAMAVQMVSLGEETGRLGEMLVHVAEELDKKIQAKVKTGLSLLEPATILLMGLLIGGIVVSMLSAIFGINDIQF